MKNNRKLLLQMGLVLCLVFSLSAASLGAAVPIFPSKGASLSGGAYLIFCGKTGGKIAKKDFEGQARLSLDGCPGAKESTILRFKLELTKAGKTTTLTSNTDRLTSEMVAKLKTLAVGDSFEFKKVMARWPNQKEEYEVHTQRFTVSHQGA